MTIFRGAGGGGNVTTGTELTAITSLSAAATASAASAGTSATSAAASASAAATSASAASTRATNASASAAAAAASEASLNAATLVHKTSSTGSVLVSTGTTAQRDAAPSYGAQRANSTLNQQEWWNGTAWVPMGGGATGGGTDAALYENDLLGTANYTIGQGALISGATITIATPAVVTLANTFTAGQPVRFTTTGALPTGLSTTAAYYVISAGLTTSAFQVSTTSGGSAVNTSGSQSGVHSAGKIKNASTVGPFIVASGVVYTVPSGSRWVVQ